ncbi:hypothetical protein [Leptolyngbya phage Lbo-JY16]
MTKPIRLPKPAKLIEYGVYVACFLGSIYVFASAVAEVVRP